LEAVEFNALWNTLVSSPPKPTFPKLVNLTVLAAGGVGAAVAETETVAVADLLESASLVAVIVSVPAFAGAVYIPDAEMFPRAAFHVTVLSVTVPWTLAVNCNVPPVLAEVDAGDTEIEVTVGVGAGVAAVTETLEVAVLLESALLVAVIVSVPAFDGAM
jgi:hypothetical protein